MLPSKELNRDRTAKALFVFSGLKARDVARSLGRSEAWISLMLSNRLKTRKGRKEIAKAIGRPVTDLWPEEGLREKAA